jgi:hypothetical protein
MHAHSTVLSLLLVLVLRPSLTAREWTLQVELDGRAIQGTPLAWNDSYVRLLGRDGRLWEFSPARVEKFEKVSDGFIPYSQGAVRGVLMSEFGPAFDVSGTGHYLVVHPKNQRDKWARRFEELYRSMARYFTARGFSLQKPRFPLVAVVFPNQADYLRYLHHVGSNANGTLGVYLFDSNRVYMWDSTAGRPESEWYRDAETIIHEAMHQTSYNTGLTNRDAPSPAWLDEGLGTLFEARGVWNSSQYRELNDRINRVRLAAYRSLLGGGKQRGLLEQLMSRDRLLQSSPEVGYALSWATTFYLAEKEPRTLVEILKITSSREPSEEYTSPKRLRDARRVFGENLGMLEMRIDRFVMSLPD